ncbi:MAG: hypothetical protein NTW80_10650 [Deltaproteobacteria bacterium]|nr:hypothetical protein [Deltaproteobacteria bacterium]
MNFPQKAVILIGVIIILLLGLYPPWIHTTSFDKGHSKEARASIYGLIFNPPEDPSGSRIRNYIVMDSGLDKDTKRDELSKFNNNYRWGVVLDAPRLLVQWAMVIITVTGLLLVLKKSG